MVQRSLAEFVAIEDQPARPRIASLLSNGIFSALVLVLILVAVPYGTAEPWWKAAFICVVFALAICAVVESLLSDPGAMPGISLLLPMLALTAFALLQTLSLPTRVTVSDTLPLSSWKSISADPYQTRFFAFQLMALTVFLALLYRYIDTQGRIRTLVYAIMAVAVASAVFGILRQTTQHQLGFGLPLLKPNQGYGQFINKNHFAFLMEMALGLGLGLIVSGGGNRERSMIYVALLLPIWTGLVLSNSRGGILAMFSQFLLCGLLVINANSRFDGSQRSLTLGRSLVLRSVLLFALVFGLLWGAVWVGGDSLVSNFEAVNSEFDPDPGGSRGGATRNEIWRASWNMFKAHPMLGVGLGGYWVAITAYHDASGMVTPQEAHNDYLELLSSGGLVGFALGVWFFVAAFRLARKNLMSSNQFTRAVCFGAVLGIAGVAVHSLVDFGLHMIANAIVFITLLMMATSRVHCDSEVGQS